MSAKPQTLSEVRALAEQSLGDPESSQHFLLALGVTPEAFAALDEQAQAKHLQQLQAGEQSLQGNVQKQDADSRLLLNAMLTYVQMPEKVDSDWLCASIQRHAAGLSLCTPAPKLEMLLDEKLDQQGGIAHGNVEIAKASLSDLYAKWDKLRNVTVTDAGVIKQDHFHFKAGTHREEIWRWFESQNPQFIVAEVMEGIRRQEEEIVPNYQDQAAISAKEAAKRELQQALKNATECGLLDDLAGVLHPDAINQFCDAVAALEEPEKARDESPSPGM